jgi:hypothetical protein
VPDYSEFPTTPTAWQDAALRDSWQEVQPVPVEDPAPPARRGVDRVSLVAGLFFTALAVVVLAGVPLSASVFRDGGLAWVVLIGLGVLLLAGEIRKARRRPR